MKHFLIRDLERLSGIKKHTIRIWEQRYHLFTPQRKSGNIRTYLLADVQRLLHIALLNKNGFRISDLAKMDSGEIEWHIAAISKQEGRFAVAVNRLIVAMYASDTEAFDNTLDEALLTWGTYSTVTNIVIPFLQHVNLLSYQNSSSEAHFAITAVRRKIILGIEKVNPAVRINKTILLFLPKDEHYDLLLLYMSYVLKCCGLKVLYLGTNISLENLKEVIRAKNPDSILTYLPPKTSFKVADLSKYLAEQFPQKTLYIAKSEQANTTDLKAGNVQYLHFSEVQVLAHPYKCFGDE